MEIRKNGYRVNVWRGEATGAHCYEVITPEDVVIVRGARLGTRAEVLDQLRKFLRRSSNYIGLPLKAKLGRL